ncbi:MAG: hypothetical protein R3E88_21570 [Myxococcota bacterium]
MPVRPAGATVLATLFLLYGALTLLAFPIGLLRADAEPQVSYAALAALVGVLAITTGVQLWKLAPNTRLALLGWASALTLFNANLFLEFQGDARLGMAIGIPGVLLVVFLLYRYVKRVCVAAA